jgi:hypothetical protein
MAEINSPTTFRPDIDGPSIPTFMIMSGDALRKLHVSREYGTQIVNWEKEGTVPSCVPAKEFEELIEKWSKEAESMYPGEGDHRVRLLDENGDRIPIGSEVEFIIEDRQTEVPVCEEDPCEEYLWDLSQQKPEDVVKVEYINCKKEVVVIERTVRELGINVYLCVSEKTVKADPNTCTATGQYCNSSVYL